MPCRPATRQRNSPIPTRTQVSASLKANGASKSLSMTNSPISVDSIAPASRMYATPIFKQKAKAKNIKRKIMPTNFLIMLTWKSCLTKLDLPKSKSNINQSYCKRDNRPSKKASFIPFAKNEPFITVSNTKMSKIRSTFMVWYTGIYATLFSNRFLF